MISPTNVSCGVYIGMEFTRTVQSSSPTPSEHNTTVLRDNGPIPVEVLNRVEEILRRLKPQVEAALIEDAEAELRVVRVDPSSTGGRHRLGMALYKIAEPFAMKA